VTKMTIKVRKPEIKENKIHIEQEEKPIVEPLTMTSEDVHGGDEITRSVDDQRFAQQEYSEEESETEQTGEESETGEQKEQSKENEKNGKDNGEEENEEETEQEEQREQKGQENEEHEGQQEPSETGEQKEENQNTKEQEQEQTGEENQEEEPKKQEEQSKTENTEQAFKLKKETVQHLHLELYKLIEYLQDEEKSLTPEPVSQSQALGIKKLMFRQYERKPLSSYYYYKERSQAILIIDNSGSMTWLETELDTFFAVALKRRDIQVFIAPNGIIESVYNFKTKTFEEIEHETAMKKIVQTGLPIIYIGDFDGADTPIELSWRNRVFWLCTETRYKYFEQHSWVNYNEEDFKGFFGRAWNIKEIIQVLQEFSKHIQQQRFWLDLHKDDIEEPENEGD